MVLSSVLNVDTLDHCSTRTENQKREIFLIPTDTRKASSQNYSKSHVIFLVQFVLKIF